MQQLEVAIDIYKKITVALDELSDASSIRGKFLRSITPIEFVEEMQLLKKELEDHGILEVLKERSN